MSTAPPVQQPGCPGMSVQVGSVTDEDRENRQEPLPLLGKRRVVAWTPQKRLPEVRSSLNKGFSGQICGGRWGAELQVLLSWRLLKYPHR